MGNKLFPVILAALTLAGCATSTRYIPYTDQKFPAKSKYYFVTVYNGSQKPPAEAPYQVIGKVEVSGRPIDGVTPELLVDKAKSVARARGADAVVNASSESATYSGTEIIPGHTTYRGFYAGHHERVYVARYHPTRYYPYVDTVLRFKGELAVFVDKNPSN